MGSTLFGRVGEGYHLPEPFRMAGFRPWYLNDHVGAGVSACAVRQHALLSALLSGIPNDGLPAMNHGQRQLHGMAWHGMAWQHT